MDKRLMPAVIFYQGKNHEGYIYDRNPGHKKNNKQYIQTLFTCRYCHHKFVERIVGAPLKTEHEAKGNYYVCTFKYLCPYCDQLDTLYTTTPDEDAEDLSAVMDTGKK